MKKAMLLVDNGPEFNEKRYILTAGEYEAPTNKEEMLTAVENFFCCPYQTNKETK